MNRLVDELLEIAFPGRLYCICCGNIIDESRTYGLCDYCITHIKWSFDEKEIETGETGAKIKVMKCAEYGIYERSIIFALKYNGHKYIAKEIGEIMKDRLEASGFSLEDPVVVPVPVHHNRLRERGYNHAELIARRLSKEIGVECVDVLARTKETLPMKNLGPADRWENLRDSMKLKDYCRAEVRGRNILLVDDFATSGSTIRECVRALAEGDPASVTALVFAGR